MRIIFVTGGARSGKSSFALKKATAIPGRKVYIATAQPLDEEMRERIERHKKERGEEWFTVEEPLKISNLLRELKERYNVLLLDCLTLWLSNILIRKQNMEKEIKDFLEIIKSFKDPLACKLCSLFIVSNEVGMGIVPENELARRFRDLAGLLNQKVAEIADEVYFLVSGIPLKIKG